MHKAQFREISQHRAVRQGTKHKAIKHGSKSGFFGVLINSLQASLNIFSIITPLSFLGPSHQRMVVYSLSLSLSLSQSKNPNQV